MLNSFFSNRSSIVKNWILTEAWSVPGNAYAWSEHYERKIMGKSWERENHDHNFGIALFTNYNTQKNEITCG